MSVALNMGTWTSTEQPEDLKGRYLVSLKLIERLHRLLLDVIKDEFERLGRSDVNGVQALLLYNIGDAELTAGELTSRGYYLGSNVSYNLKKLVEFGYINHQRSNTDRRSVRVRLTDKGQEVCKVLSALYQRQLKSLQQVGGIDANDLETLNKSPDQARTVLDGSNPLPALRPGALFEIPPVIPSPGEDFLHRASSKTPDSGFTP